MKSCTKCGEEKALEEFSPRKGRCKPCAAVEQAAYRKRTGYLSTSSARRWRKENPHKARGYSSFFRRKKWTPAWADIKAIRAFYEQCPAGLEIDHIIPLQGKTVSGLHVVANLQYLTPTQNRAKGNKYDTQTR